MPPETCPEHIKFATQQGVIINKLDNIEARMATHVTEGEKVGGWRDRLLMLEGDVKNHKDDVQKEIGALKRAMWLRTVISGILGGMIANGSDEAFRMFVKFLTGV